MSLKEAGELLGLKPNSIRSRYKKGKLRGEADNMGKLWVWIDPTKLANDRGSKEPSSKVTKKDFEGSEIKALQDQLKAITEQLDKANAEIADLKPQAMEAVRLQAEVKGLLDQQGRWEAEVSRLVASLDKVDAERRELIDAVLKRRLSLWERITGRG
jgi:chromosome segregation ATPase